MNSSYIYSTSKISVLILVLLFSFSLTASAAPPQRLILSSLSLTHDNQATYADFSVTIDDEDGLSDMLRNGATVELSIRVHVERKRSWWGNSSVNDVQYVYTLLYQPLTRDFVLSFPESADMIPARDKNLTNLLYENWRKFHLEAVTVNQLNTQPKDREYDVEIRVSTHHKEAPPWLEKNSLFWSADIVPEERISAIFRY